MIKEFGIKQPIRDAYLADVCVVTSGMMQEEEEQLHYYYSGDIE